MFRSRSWYQPIFTFLALDVCCFMITIIKFKSHVHTSGTCQFQNVNNIDPFFHEPDHVECLVRQLGSVELEELVEVLVVTPGHQKLVQPAVGLVHPVQGAKSNLSLIIPKKFDEFFLSYLRIFICRFLVAQRRVRKRGKIAHSGVHFQKFFIKIQYKLKIGHIP
jgi:hypothetical protein